ncbi:hypothetical protein CVS42_06205 [Aeromonas veronii]|uniref:response regulator n=1 Tax=Aeromonas veronii TaxID=654 RepID=UPI000C28F1B6|nr:response regulator [Aeromonas veronii]ATY80460.1 hypothetical protein CVS42_06205 [Aeromonas veronii]HEA3202497.1 response regulator [Aeromonas veronii]
MRVLVIDDHPVSLILLNHQLIIMGFSVLQSNSVEQAMGLLHNEPIDVVIIDCQILDMNGMKLKDFFCGQDNQSDFVQYITIGIVAADCSEIMLNELDSWIDFFISKPIDIKKLGTILSTCNDQINSTSTVPVKKNYSVLAILQETTSKDLDVALGCLESEDISLFTSTIHRIKGAYLMIGELEVVELCRNIESELNGDRDSQCLKLLLIALKNKVNFCAK